MKKTLLLLLVVSLSALLPLQAHAKKLRFGTEESIRFVAETTLPGPNQSRFYLGHLVQTYIFLLPYRFESKGYVLGIHGDSSKYMPLPSGADLKELQDKGFLPNPLPPIQFAWYDYAFGYSLWIVLVVLVGFPLVKRKLRGKKEAED